MFKSIPPLQFLFISLLSFYLLSFVGLFFQLFFKKLSTSVFGIAVAVVVVV